MMVAWSMLIDRRSLCLGSEFLAIIPVERISMEDER